MEWRKEWKPMLLISAGFLLCYFVPVGTKRFDNATVEALGLVRIYARHHFLLGLVPALFIAGAISTFIDRGALLKYIGPRANKVLAYSVASLAGTFLSVCSCTVLPLFAGIYRMGAGVGPATTFLYAGPAVNVLAVLLTARVLGLQLGIARMVSAVLFGVVVGIFMHLLFNKDGATVAETAPPHLPPETSRPAWQVASLFLAMIGLLVFGTWTISGQFTFGLACCPSPTALTVKPVRALKLDEKEKEVLVKTPEGETDWVEKDRIRWETPVEGTIYAAIYETRASIAGCFLLALLAMLAHWYTAREMNDWLGTTWDLTKQILPLLFLGVLLAGFLLGRPGREGIIPSEWVAQAVGGNSILANLFASVASAFMYFATLTEVPIVQGLLAKGMGQGPALALLLAGPALSLPNMLVIRSIMGTRRTIAFILIVVAMSCGTGMLYGALFP